MNVSESTFRRYKRCYRRVDVFSCFRSLTLDTILGPSTDLAVHIWPIVTCLDQPQRCFLSPVSVAVECIKNVAAIYGWDVRTSGAGR